MPKASILYINPLKARCKYSHKLLVSSRMLTNSTASPQTKRVKPDSRSKLPLNGKTVLVARKVCYQINGLQMKKRMKTKEKI